MNPEDFIKKGVVENETEVQPVKTASDEIFEEVKTCSPRCKCNCSNSKKGTSNDSQ